MIEGFAYTNQGDAVAAAGDAEAITFVSTAGTQRIGFSDFSARADDTAQRLLALRLGAGERVAILGENSIDWLVAFYGILRAGLVAVPVSYKSPPAVLDHVLINSGSALLLVDSRARADALSSDVPVLSLAEATAPAQEPGRSAVHPRGGRDAAMILYTSGSTGMPKGVELSQDSHLWVLSRGAFAAADDPSATLVAAPLYHMNALANTQANLLAGRRTVLLSRFTADGFLRAAAAESVSRLTGVPPMFALALKERHLLDELDLSRVREIYMGSSPASDDLFARLADAFPSAAVNFGYGTTETGPIAFTRHPDGRATPLGSVGVRHPDVELRLVDDLGREADEGILQIRVPAMFTRYYGRDDIPSPMTADGYYHTRDAFRRDPEGFYFFTGRSDDMFTSGGENVYPRAVELALERHPAVSEAAVVPVPDPVKGARPVAFVVPAPGAEPDEAELRAWSLTALEPFAHPRRVFLLTELPLSSTNKVDRALLTRRAEELTGETR